MYHIPHCWPYFPAQRILRKLRGGCQPASNVKVTEIENNVCATHSEKDWKKVSLKKKYKCVVCTCMCAFFHGINVKKNYFYQCLSSLCKKWIGIDKGDSLFFSKEFIQCMPLNDMFSRMSTNFKQVAKT